MEKRARSSTPATEKPTTTAKARRPATSAKGGEPATSAKRPYDASRRQADAEERRRRVVHVGTDLFLDQGYGGTSIAAVAEAAGVSTAFVYAAFESKAGILAAAANAAVAGTTEDVGLLRDQPEIAALREPGVPAPTRIAGMAAAARIVHGRSAPLLRLVEMVAGSDETVLALHEQFIAGQREDALVAAGAFAPGELRADLTLQDVADVAFAIGGVRTYAALVLDAGWSPERYQAWFADALARLLLA